VVLSRVTGLPSRAATALTREALVARLVAVFEHDPAKGWPLVRELDRSTEAERSLVRSMPTDRVEPDVGSLDILRFKRHGARILWALARDEREEVQRLSGQVTRAYVAEADRLRRAREQVREKGAAEELAEFESLYQVAAERVLRLEEEHSAVERERARLIAEIGRREKELREEGERRRRLADELSQARRAPPSVAAPVRATFELPTSI